MEKLQPNEKPTERIDDDLSPEEQAELRTTLEKLGLV